MHLSKEDEINIERWLVRQLELMHLNNAETLSKYILSLLKQERDNLKQFCCDELRTFLKERTEDFVALLFSSLQGFSFTVIIISLSSSVFFRLDGSYRVTDAEEVEFEVLFC
jgi:ABC-type uncharacterized transport system fused permease/ATPase subunit